MMMIFGSSALNRVGYLRWIVIIIAGAFRMGSATPCMSQDTPAPVDLVNPYIGSISHLLVPTFPTVHRPFGMIRFWPETNPGIPDTWLADRIFGFPLNRPEYRGNPCTTVMPFMGMKSLQRNHPGSSFDHDFETVTPYYYSVELEDLDMKVEFSPTERCGMFVFSPAKTDDLVLLFQTEEESRFQLKSNHNLTGYENYRGVRQYFTIFFNHPVKRSGYLNESGRPVNSRAHKGKKLYWFVVFDGSLQVKMNYAISWINNQQASRNLLNENPGWDFHKTVKKGRAAWNRELGRITVRGGAKNQQITFYTALYRSMERMININEYGRYFSGYDHRVHKTKHNFYVDDWSWDTYRTLHPLRLLFAPDRERDMIRSYILMYRQSGWMPTFPEIYGDAKCMIGHHQAAIIADAWFKGIRGFDIKKAYEGLRKNAFESTMLPWREGPATELDRFYREHGYFPALAPGGKESEPEADGFEKRQAVAVTLEHSYDDWCLGRLAKAWNHPGDTAELMKRSLNYRNVFNPETGFMSPKKADGSWVTPFNPKTSGGTGCRDYFAEVNSWNYTWSIPQDPQGLIKLMGGNEAFIAKLDQLFEEPLVGYGKWGTLSDQPDATGLTGQFVMGNEPGFHIPYLYT
ncbi:MAG: GH92 family glycosyl hydrolase, partial [Bacteroidales bacterium]|nr:GH92 family glycosyl hydrolase [Bacteroidales bacterium]